MTQLETAYSQNPILLRGWDLNHKDLEHNAVVIYQPRFGKKLRGKIILGSAVHHAALYEG